MTLTPAEVAKMDQVFAHWTEWYATLTDPELGHILKTFNTLVAQASSLSHNDRKILDGIFRNGLCCLQLATHSMRTMA